MYMELFMKSYFVVIMILCLIKSRLDIRDSPAGYVGVLQFGTRV